MQELRFIQTIIHHLDILTILSKNIQLVHIINFFDILYDFTY